MSEDSPELVELDRLSIEILKALSELGGEATSVDLRKSLGVDKRQKLFYRFTEYLVPEGLVETHQPETDEPGPHPPKIVRITDYGQEYIQSVDSGISTGEIAERLERLEQEVEGLRQENQELREVVEESDVEMVTGRVQELTDDVDRLQAKMSNLQDALGDLNSDPVIGSATAQNNINTGLVLGNALRELAIEEFGEDRVMDLISEKQEKFAEEDELV